MFNDLNGFIESKCNDAEYDNAGDYHIKLEYLGTVYDQISKTSSGGKKFTDNDSHKGQTDIYLCGAEQNGHRARKYHFKKSISPTAAQRIYQGDFFRIDLLKTCVETYDGAKYSHGDTGYDNGFCAGAKPYDEQWCQCRFRQAV